LNNGDGHAELLVAFGELMRHALPIAILVEARNGVASKIK
jgi:hypothetical protein